MGLLDHIRDGSYTAGPATRGESLTGRSVSLAEVAIRVTGGEDLLPTVRDFLDQANRRDEAELAELIGRRPEPTGDRQADALLAGVAEHLAAVKSLPCPLWVREPERFLNSFWFVSDVPGFRAIALAQTPIALKRRGIFWPARSLERV
ncbi:MAG: hypothetical protein M3364_00420 [Actinomycetota bacterium]|nr:hypothetical protein [Actinomycetota bacterium]